MPRTIQALEAVLKVDSADIESARQLAKLLEPLGDAKRSEDAYRRVVGIDPFDRDAQAAYGRLALKRKDTRRGRPRLPRGAGQQPARSRAGARRSGGGVCLGRPGARGEEGDTRGARDRTFVRARTGSAAEGGRALVNSQLPTSNFQLPSANRSRLEPWELGVGSWELTSDRSEIVPPLDPLTLRPPEGEHAHDAGGEARDVRPEGHAARRDAPSVAAAIEPTPLSNCITNQMPRKKMAGTSMI